MASEENMKMAQKNDKKEKKSTISDMVEEELIDYDNLSIEALFEELKNKENFFALVKDRRGGLVGLITAEDVIEELFGEIEDEYDRI